MIFGIILITSIFLGLHLNERLEIPSKIFIPKGSISQIISHIDRDIKGNFYPTDKYVVVYFGQPQSGWIQLPEKNMRRIDFLKAITQAKAPPSKKITLIPGETTEYFIYSLAEKYRVDYKKLYQYYLEISPLKEGFLIPETYHINLEGDLNRFIKKLINYAKKIHTKNMKKYDLENLKELNRVLVIASIIQKESASKEEMKLIASVIFNRLEKGMKLQMDGTLNYGLYSHIKITAKRIRSDISEFNTYKIKGLPQTPICNPSFEAIESALYPETSKFLYFVKIKDEKRHIFSKTYQQHLKEIKQFR